MAKCVNATERVKSEVAVSPYLHVKLDLSFMSNNKFEFIFSGTNETPNIDTIDSYMMKLHSRITESTQHEKLFTKVKQIINKIDFET